MIRRKRQRQMDPGGVDSTAISSKRLQSLPLVLEKEIPVDSEESFVSDTSVTDYSYCSTCSIQHVSIDILSKIIGNIPVSGWPTLELVSKHLRTAVLAAWRNLRTVHLIRDFGMMKKRDETTSEQRLADLLRLLSDRSPFISQLGGFGKTVNKLKPSAIDQLCKFTCMEHLTLTNCSITPPYLLRLLRDTGSHQRLRYLNISDCLNSVDCRIVTKLALEFGRFKLQTFICVMNVYLQGAFLEFLDGELLERLEFFGSSISAKNLAQVLRRCPKLTILNISNYDRSGMNVIVDKTVLNWLKDDAVHLTALKMDNHSNERPNPVFVTDLCLAFQGLGERRTLSELSLKNCRYCDDELVTTIALHLGDSLKVLHIDITGCSTNALKKLLQRLIVLNRLTLWSTEKRSLQINDDVIRTLATNQRLQRLSLPAPAVQPRSLEELIKLTDLKHLEVRELIDNHVLMHLAKGIGQQIESLQLLNCSSISDKGIVVAAKHLPRVRLLSLDNCKITDVGLRALAQSCKELRLVNFRNCRQVTTVGVTSLVSACPQLNRVYVDSRARPNQGLNRSIEFSPS